jgi:hypothetical protein
MLGKESTMGACEFVDYSERPESLITLYEFRHITPADIPEVRDIIPGQMDQVDEGDALIVSIIDNRIEGVKGLLTVWPGKRIACIDAGNGIIWGEWEEDHNLVMTEEFEEEKDDDGQPVMGRIAYNTHGMRGIFSRGSFYTLHDTDTGVLESA